MPVFTNPASPLLILWVTVSGVRDCSGVISWAHQSLRITASKFLSGSLKLERTGHLSCRRETRLRRTHLGWGGWEVAGPMNWKEPLVNWKSSKETTSQGLVDLRTFLEVNFFFLSFGEANGGSWEILFSWVRCHLKIKHQPVRQENDWNACWEMPWLWAGITELLCTAQGTSSSQVKLIALVYSDNLITLNLILHNLTQW